MEEAKGVDLSLERLGEILIRQAFVSLERFSWNSRYGHEKTEISSRVDEISAFQKPDKLFMKICFSGSSS